jgi:hypothetical protein
VFVVLEPYSSWLSPLSTGFDKWMEEVGKKVARVLNAEASHNWIVECTTDQVENEVTVEGLTKKYPWWNQEKN